MPRSGAGVYTPTAGIPVVSGTTISSTAFNNVIDDLGDEITASLPVSGVAPMTGVLRVTLGSVSAPGLAFSGDTDTGIYSTGANTFSIATAATNAVTFSATQTSAWSGKAVGKAFDVDAITDVASASTCDIGAAATSEVRITGTTTITSFGTANAGIRRRGRFADALTLTHNGTSLILPGGANITTAANDCFDAISLGSGNWIVTNYQKASGVAIVVSSVTGRVVQIAQQATSAVATGTTQLPYDDTIPQNTEGDQYLTVSITPTSASNILEIEVNMWLASSASAGYMNAALFQDSTANALTAGSITFAGANYMVNPRLIYRMTAGTTSSTTFNVRAGANAAGTTTFNGSSGGRIFGGVINSFIRVREIAA